MTILFQLFGTAGGAFGLYGFYTGNMTFMIIGLVISFLFCWEGDGSMVEMILMRIFVIPVLSLIGMLICHFAIKMGWGMGYLVSLNWLYAVMSFLMLIYAIKNRH